jgi:hypothetical protein
MRIHSRRDARVLSFGASRAMYRAGRQLLGSLPNGRGSWRVAMICSRAVIAGYQYEGKTRYGQLGFVGIVISDFQVSASRFENVHCENDLPVEQFLYSGSLYTQAIHSDAQVALRPEIHLETHKNC